MVAEKLFHIPGHLRLGAAGDERARNPLHELVVQDAGLFKATDLFRVLDHAQGFHHAVGPLQGQAGGDLFVSVKAEVLGFKTHGSRDLVLDQAVYLFHGAAFIDEDAILIDFDGGKAAGELARKKPVRRRPPPVEQPRLGEHEGPGASGNHAAIAVRRAAQALDQLGRQRRNGRPASDQQRVEEVERRCADGDDGLSGACGRFRHIFHDQALGRTERPAQHGPHGISRPRPRRRPPAGAADA